MFSVVVILRGPSIVAPLDRSPSRSEPSNTGVMNSSNTMHDSDDLESRRSPAPLTPFVGRERELGELAGLLADPACHLLTLVGPGGIGKTRLALQAATMLSDSAPRVVFVDLAPIRSLDLFVSAIADALHVPLSGQASLQAQLLNLLSDKQILLLLDNLEHLLAEDFGASDITGYLTALLQTASGVKLLVTERSLPSPRVVAAICPRASGTIARRGCRGL